MDFYLLSNASVDLYPGNTLASFTNQLPTPLNLPTNEAWALSLQNISITAKFKEGFERNIIKVECKEIKPSIDGNCFSRLLGIFAYQSDSHGLCYYEFIGNNYFLLENSYITSFTIRLLDVNNKPIVLKHGHTTLLKLHLKKMEHHKDIILHINSKSTTDYPENKPHSFTVQLPKELTLHGNWKVALTSITYPPMEKDLFSTDQLILFKTGNRRKAFTFEISKSIRSIKELADRLIHLSASTFNKLFLFFHENRLMVIVSDQMRKVAIAFTEELRIMLNIKDEYASSVENMAYWFQNESARRQDDPPQENGIKYLTAGQYTIGSQIDYDYSVLKYLFVYGDFIDRTILGNSFVPIIKIIPLSEVSKIRKNQPTSYNFQFREYYKVSNSHLTTLSFKVTDENGGKIIYPEDSNIYITLRFRLFE